MWIFHIFVICLFCFVFKNRVSLFSTFEVVCMHAEANVSGSSLLFLWALGIILAISRSVAAERAVWIQTVSSGHLCSTQKSQVHIFIYFMQKVCASQKLGLFTFVPCFRRDSPALSEVQLCLTQFRSNKRALDKTHRDVKRMWCVDTQIHPVTFQSSLMSVLELCIALISSKINEGIHTGWSGAYL